MIILVGLIFIAFGFGILIGLGHRKELKQFREFERETKKILKKERIK